MMEMEQTEMTEERIHLPPKIVNLGQVPTADNNVPVQLNGFRMNLGDAPQEVFQFEIRFYGTKTVNPTGQQPQTKEWDLAKGPKNDESKETRRRLLWALFNQLFDRNEDFFGKHRRIFTFDCAQQLYCTNDLGLEVGSPAHEFLLDYDPVALEERCRAYIRRFDRIRITILRTGTLNIKDASAAYIQGDRSVVQYLEILSSQRLFEQQAHYCFGNRMYEAESNIQLQQDPRVLKEGMQKNVRFVGDTQENAGPILQLDPKKSAFFPAVKLVDFVSNFLQMNVTNLQRDWERNLDRMNKQIKGLVLVTTHLDSPITFANQGFLRNTPDQHTFERNGRRVTIQQHYEETYNLNLQYPKLPCVIQRKPQSESYYPMEVLKIVEGQRVPIEKQTPKLVENMIRQCQVLPANLPDQIKKQQVQAMAQNANPFFQRQGVKIETELIRSKAQQLHLPAIEYANQDKVEPEPNRGLSNWRMVGRDVNPRRAFVEAAQFPKNWIIVIVQNCVRQEACQRFLQSFVQTAVSRGLTDCKMPSVFEQFTQTDMEYVNTRFNTYAHNGCRFVLCFAPGKRDARAGDIHHVLKLMEQKHGVLTQHISPDIVQKGAGGGGGAAMVVENILMKTNLKLGGANYALTTSEMFKRAAHNKEDTLGEVWLSGKRMFMGIDFSHAPPQSLYDRKTGKEPAIPTVVGMAWTVGKKMLKMRGTYWMQQARTTTMSDHHVHPLIRNIKNALIGYQAQNGDFPNHIIVFRGGASEGEFKRISFWEGNAFVHVFSELANMFGPNFQPPAVTIVVCQRQSNYRMIPTNINRQAKAPEQNVQPGTVVDKGVMNAALTEFLLIAHKALQGTAQPVRCSVVHEWRPIQGPASRFPGQIPLEELENVTNALCWTHGIFTGSTAVPGVLYAAGELTKRGRNNWKMHTEDGAANVPQFDLPPFGQEGAEMGQAQEQLDDQRATYFNQVSVKLEPNDSTKFWA